VHDILRDGTGADRQLRAFEKRGNIHDVVEYLADETLRGVREPVGQGASA
jgi:carboxylate-amine ligase